MEKRALIEKPDGSILVVTPSSELFDPMSVARVNLFKRGFYFIKELRTDKGETYQVKNGMGMNNIPKKFAKATIVYWSDEEILEWEMQHVIDAAETHEDPKHRFTGAKKIGIIDRDQIPSREFRDAWKNEGGKIGHDMPKARELHKKKLRELRAPKLAALDLEYQRADEADDKAGKKKIAAKKQALRDVTADPAIEAAATVSELAAVIPDVLKS